VKAKRASLTPKERKTMAERQGGLCFSFGCTGKPAVAEHWVCVALGNDQKPDCLLCKPCADAKTKRDIAAIAKVKRLQRGKKPTKRPIPSRGFDKRFKRRIDGTVTRV
jgi:hypothetical protein